MIFDFRGGSVVPAPGTRHAKPYAAKRPAKYPRWFHDYEGHRCPSTRCAFYSHVAFRFCGLTHRLRLVVRTGLVPHLVSIPAQGFEGRVIITSTAGFSRYKVVTYCAH
jgi:hypothetical protein